MENMKKRRCIVCHCWFEPRRITHVICGALCKLRKWRKENPERMKYLRKEERIRRRNLRVETEINERSVKNGK